MPIFHLSPNGGWGLLSAPPLLLELDLGEGLGLLFGVALDHVLGDSAIELRHVEDRLLEVVGQLVREEPPLPVGAGGGRMVHARLVALAEEILQRDDASVRNAGEGGADEVPGEGVVVGVQRVDVLAGEVPRFVVEVLNPAADGLVVVRAGVDDAVVLVEVRQVIALLARIESELQDLHAREARVLDELDDAVGDIAKILGDDMDVAELPLDHVEEIHARSLDPFAGSGSRGAIGDDVVFVKCTEVVDAEDVAELHAALKSLDPPFIVVPLQIRPVVNRVAPELAVRGEGIGRAARHGRRDVLLVEEVHLRLAPGVRAVVGGVEGDVADNLHAVVICILVKLLPLLIEFILHETLQTDRVGILFPCLLDCFRLLGLQLFRPAFPAAAAVGFLDGHEQGEAVQPVIVLLAEGLVFRLLRGVKTLVGNLEGLVPGVVNGAVVDGGRVGAEVHLVQLLLLYEAFLAEGLKVDEIGIPGKCREALVGGVAVAGRSERKHLPVGLAGIPQEINKFIGFLGEAADPVLRS